MMANSENPCLSEQIIAYIGNKRRLLPLIREAVSSCVNCGNTDGKVFLDLFAGSGIVSRLAKTLGFRVVSNDWEYYSYIINRAYVGTDASDIDRLFGGISSFVSLIEKINALAPPCEDGQYMARYYAPGSFEIEKADFRKERLFYTRDNALRIDSIRNYIGENFDISPPGSSFESGTEARAGDLLLGMLLYGAATHTNTSGVFKAFHKGFGGHGRDALSRITREIRLEYPPLCDSPYRAEVYMEDASSLVSYLKTGSVDVAYLDPPYNQHQYGSNYHILNTIALWDRIPVPPLTGEDGKLLDKAAIRKDWTKTRSDYCCRNLASSSFRELMDKIDAANIIVSYSTDGIIPFEEIRDICASRGKLSFISNEYTKFRGGRQSSGRVNTNIEFVMIIDTSSATGMTDLKKLDSLIARKKRTIMLQRIYSPEKLKNYAEILTDGTAVFRFEGESVCFRIGQQLQLLPEGGAGGDNGNFIFDSRELLWEKLDHALCKTREEELDAVFFCLENSVPYVNHSVLIRMIPSIIRKLAHRKTSKSFYTWLDRIMSLEDKYPELYGLIKNRIKDVSIIAEKRFSQ